MIDLTKKYKRNGVPVEVGVIGGVLISVDRMGGIYHHNEDGFCLYSSFSHLTLYTEWEDFKDDEQVMVRDLENGPWFRRHFAGVKNGWPTTYYAGATKWSSNGDRTTWNFCRRPTKEELGE